MMTPTNSRVPVARRRSTTARGLVALATAAVMIVAGCGGDDDATDASQPVPEATGDGDVEASEASADAPVGSDEPATAEQSEDGEAAGVEPAGKLVIWEHANDANEAYFTSKYDEYQAEFPDVEIEVLYVPIADLQTKLVAAFGAGNPPDIIKNGAWQIAGFVDKEQLAPVDPVSYGASDMTGLTEGFEPGSLDGVTVDDDIYGIPTDFNSVSLWYRKDRFEEAGLDPEKPPTTWEEVFEYNDALTNDDGTRVGLQPPIPGDPIWSQLTFRPLLEGLGGSLFNDDMTAGSLNTEEGIAALEAYARIGNPELSSAAPGFRLFLDGVVGMQWGGRWIDSFMSNGSEGELAYGDDYATVTLPVWDGMDPVASGYTWAWSVAEASENQATAWHLIGWLNSPDNINAQLDATGLVTPIVGWTEQPAAQDEASAVMQEQLPYTTYGVSSPQWSELMTALADTLDAVWFGQRSPADAAADFDDEVAGILG